MKVAREYRVEPKPAVLHIQSRHHHYHCQGDDYQRQKPVDFFGKNKTWLKSREMLGGTNQCRLLF